ncbi:MAG: PolC-type DNA polymerase III, partial [Lachnospiraceae bacterium]|nr:PolC-type DNA polymerase III [Lachnospiraceae bacterium]
ILNERGDAAIVRDASWYDFLEIVPADNLRHFINDDKMPTINSIQDIRDINKRILALGKELGKPVCACGDVHYLDPDDVLYEKILKAREIKKRFRKKSKDGSRDIWKDEEKSIKEKEEEDKLLAKKKPAKEEFNSILENISKQMYFMTTSEMLDEFQYLGADDAFETVITAPNKIADMCDVISPVRPDKCPPVIEDSDKTLRRICYDKAHELYGDELPPVVQERLERELNSIIGNGYAVMYIIAQKLVWKSVEDGYLVGSRGSVGSSFVATMAGITEVNPLVPHYRCGKCKYSDFDSPELKEYVGRAGVDMPDKVCPVCGEMLIKDGFDIPFETFLGFKGDKEPDIDLNFSSEYQSKAHKYTEVIFGYGQTYKAGTVGTLADKNSFAITREYFDLTENKKRQAEIERLSAGIVGVRNTTGQHPGGIVVLPEGEDINSFTPIQHPADDMESNIITTHFDYHKIDQNLLKLDILGHDDPTMIRMLQDLTNVDPLDIPLDDPGVMSLFKNTE